MSGIFIEKGSGVDREEIDLVGTLHEVGDAELVVHFVIRVGVQNHVYGLFGIQQLLEGLQVHGVFPSFFRRFG